MFVQSETLPEASAVVRCHLELVSNDGAEFPEFAYGAVAVGRVVRIQVEDNGLQKGFAVQNRAFKFQDLSA